jgi:hypothetical protein
MNDSLIPTATSSIYMEDILSINFDMIKMKLQDKEDGLGWSPEQCNEAEAEYTKFLALKRTYPNTDIVPHKAIDDFWHQHILDTEKYAADCDLIFGQFLHHYPYFGIKDEQDRQDLIDAFEETKRLYFENFGKPYTEGAKKCKPKNCRTACKPVKCK